MFEYDLQILFDTVLSHLPRVISAFLTLFIGFKLIKLFIKFLDKFFKAKDYDPSLEGFISSFAGIALKIILIISVIGMLGFEMTSLLALMGGAGVAVGMALSGTLQNFAGGVMILVFKPFKVGDFIEAQGYSGKVKEIQIFSTILTTPDNKTVFIPNAPLSNQTLVNYSYQKIRRIDLVIGISYNDNIDKARKILLEIAQNQKGVLKDKPVDVHVSELADSSVNLILRFWVSKDDYWDTKFGLNEKAKNAFDENGISIPYPHQDIYLHQADS